MTKKYDGVGGSNTDLLGLILGDAQAAYNIMQYAGGSLKTLSSLQPHELFSVVTERRSMVLAAIFELARRKGEEREESCCIKTSRDGYTLFRSRVQDLSVEVFCVAFLNRSNRVLKIDIISTGGITGTVADPRIILKKALDYRAVNLLLCHNHPSGSVKPSRQDEEFTSKIKQAAAFLTSK